MEPKPCRLPRTQQGPTSQLGGECEVIQKKLLCRRRLTSGNLAFVLPAITTNGAVPDNSRSRGEHCLNEGGS
jgi:hypothetical protein